MRAECRLITACIALLLSSVVSITSGSDRTHGPALNSATVSSRPKTNTSTAPSFLTSRDSTSAVDVIDHEGSNDEERSWREVLLDASNAIEAASSELPSLDHLHPSKLFEQLDIAAENEKSLIHEKITQWIKCAIKYHDQFDSFGHNDVVDFLQTKLNWNAEQLVKFFASLRPSSGIQEDQVFALQKALGDKFPLDAMLPLWLESNVDPRKVYQMMSISTESMLTSAAATKTDTFNKLISWIVHADTSFVGSQPYTIILWLAKFRQPEELLILFTSLPVGFEQRADRWQTILYKEFTQLRPKLIKIWLKLGKTPEDVYGFMLLNSRIDYGRIHLEPAKWATMFDVNMEWVLYIDEYMDLSTIFSMDKLMRDELIQNIVPDMRDIAVAAQHKTEEVDRLRRHHTAHLMLDVCPVRDIPYKALVGLLEDEAMAERVKDRAIAELLMKQTSNTNAAAVFFHSLRSYHTGWMFRADRMQQQLLSLESTEAEKVVFGLWVASHLSPEDVYHIMPFASEERFGPVKGRTELAWGYFCNDFKQWLRYVDLCNGGTIEVDRIKFGDAKVVRVLRRRRKKELKYLLSDVRKEPGQEKLEHLLEVAAPQKKRRKRSTRVKH